MSNLNDLVADPSTLTSLNRLGDTFNLVQDAGQKIVPAQTVCNYWNYWMTYLTSHFELPTPFGYAERVIPPSIAGIDPPEHAAAQPDGQLLRRPGRRPLLEQRPRQAPTPGLFSPPERPPGRTTASRSSTATPTAPSVTDGQPNCQAGQTGYALGEALIPGQTQGQPDVRRPERRQGGRRAAAGQDRPVPRAGRHARSSGRATDMRPEPAQAPLQLPDRPDRDRADLHRLLPGVHEVDPVRGPRLPAQGHRRGRAEHPREEPGSDLRRRRRRGLATSST